MSEILFARKSDVDAIGASAAALTTATLITSANETANFPASRRLIDTASVTWDFTTPGQAKATTSGGVTPAALTRVDDTNVTLVLGGTPGTALLQATSLTLGWNGTLSVARGGTGGGTASGTLLDNISGFASTGLIARTAASTYAFRTLTAPAAGITVSNGNGVSGNPTLALANDLSALEGLAANGIAARTAADTWAVRTITGTSAEIVVTNGDGVSGNPTLALATSVPISTITFIIDGGGATITTGVKGDLEIPFACTIQQATLLADQSGSIVVNVWKDTYANYPPVVGDKITASAPPTISTATKSQDTTLTGWTTSISAGDTLRFNVDSVTTIQRVTLSLKVKRA